MPSTNADIVTVILKYFPEVFDTWVGGPFGKPMQCLEFDDVGFNMQLTHIDGGRLIDFVDDLERSVDVSYDFSIEVSTENTDFNRLSFMEMHDNS